MLYLIGIGLNGLNSISISGLKIAKQCSQVYLETYTSVSPSLSSLQKEVPFIEVDREFIEQKIEPILKQAKKEDIAILFIGDVFGATTHIDIVLRAREAKVKVEVIGGQSILSAIGCVGLSLYKFGKTVSIPFDLSVTTPALMIKENQKNKMHTLVLLDLDPKENKYLSIKDALKYLLKTKVVTSKDKVIGCARIGQSSQKIMYNTISQLKSVSFDKPPYCILIPSKELHFMEEEALEQWT